MQEGVEEEEAQGLRDSKWCSCSCRAPLDVQPEEHYEVFVQVDDSDSEKEDEYDAHESIPDLAAELDFERVEADINN